MKRENVEKLKRVLKDPKLYIETFMQIVDKNGKRVPFKLNNTQTMLLEGMEKYNIILKSRQQGISVFCMAYALFLCCTKPDVHCLFVSHNQESTRNVFLKAKQLVLSIPEAVRPKLERNNRQELAFSNGSVISCATLGGKEVGRGASYSLVHVSELGFTDNGEKQLLAIQQAMNPNCKLVIESTANGIGNYFHDLWTKTVNQETAFKGFFFSYLQGIDMFIPELELTWQTFCNRLGRDPIESDLTDEEKALKKLDDRFTLKILLWRRLKISNSSEEQFNQEFPLTAEMAFLNSGTCIFDNAQIHECLNHLPTPIKVTHAPLIQYQNRGLSIFKEPIHGRKYSIGVDVSEGIGKDNSAISVFDTVEAFEVAHFTSNKIASYELATIVYEVGKYYNNGLLVIEKQADGAVVLNKLYRDWGYINIYKQKYYDNTSGKTKRKIGFDTNGKTRPILIAQFREAFETGTIRINSKETYREMLTFVADDNGKIQHTKSSTDDNLIAVAMAIYGLGLPHYARL